jgi:hypothetical protein
MMLGQARHNPSPGGRATAAADGAGAVIAAGYSLDWVIAQLLLVDTVHTVQDLTQV